MKKLRKDLDENGLIRVGAEVKEGDILIGKDYSKRRNRSNSRRETASAQSLVIKRVM